MDCPEELRESVGTGRAQGMDRGQLESFFRERFLGTYLQRPHRYSAAKYRGKPLYRYARRGMDVEKPPVKRLIKKLLILSWNYPEVVFEAQVGSGTYVRGLFEDFARSLGSRGALVGLKRTALGPCLIEDAIGMQELDPAHLDRYAKSPAELFG